MLFSSSAVSPSTESRLPSLQRSVKILVGLLSILLLTGGSRVSAKTTELNQAQLEARLADPASGLRDIVDMIEKSMITGEIWPVEELVDQQAILDRATGGVSIKEGRTMKEVFSDSTRQNWLERGITHDFAGTNFRFLRVRTFKDRAGLLFRSAGDNSSLNFFSFTIQEITPGDFKITDIYTLGLNEYTSETLRRTYRHLAASLEGPDARDLATDSGAFAENIEQIATVSQQLKAGEWSKVLENCATLPPVVQRNRGILLMRLEAAENYSVTSRAEVLEDWLKAYPDEMDLPLKLADHYLTQERWDDAERVVTRLLDRTGGDARLMLQIGNINYLRRHEQQRLQASAKSN